MKGLLFTQYFLSDGIRTTPEWEAAAATLADFRQRLGQTYERFRSLQQPNEAVTEQDFIRPVMELLGWTDYLPQQGAAGHEDVPDHLLFADAASKARATARLNSEDRFQDALIVEESKRFGLALDQRDRTDGLRGGSPHSQMLRYLTTADVASEGRIRFGILTNGSVWRLYDRRARPRATGFFETDLAELIQPGNEDGLRIFLLLFGRASFTLQGTATTTFLEAAIAEGRRYEQSVAQDLSNVVFEHVFPRLVAAVADAAGVDSLSDVRAAARIFLYRLLFVLYAEDRGLLPVNDARYDDYGLRKRVREDVARRMAEGDTFSSTAAHYYNRLTELFLQIDRGDESIGLPPYDGGLFAPEAAPVLERIRLPDTVVADIIYDLSHTAAEAPGDGSRRFVNYRDMSVQQLGSIYERLLEREPTRRGRRVEIRLDSYARKDSGSFYTPQELVDLILDQTLKPLAEERLQAFEARAQELASDRRPKADRMAALARRDPAEAVLRLKVLDPAMGSGHFLVSAVDFLSDYIAELIEYVPAVPEWLDGAYESPLVGRIAEIRQGILHRAEQGNWIIDAAQLTDQAIIRRMVLKRCIYGVDKNRLTVELAKVSLWLHSFTVGAPLSFLDHHLRCGDSLIGIQVRDAIRELDRLGGLFASSAMAGAEVAAEGMARIEEMSDADVVEVHASVSVFREVEETTADLRGLLDCLCGLRWMTAGMNARERSQFETPLVATLSRKPTDAYRILARGPETVSDGADDVDSTHWETLRERWQDARAIAQREEFLHWEAAFPGVWQHWQNLRPEGGFDAVIGNPPWDRIKLQEVEWFATRAREIALAPTAAARRAAIRRLRDRGEPLAADFNIAKERADQLGRMIRGSGSYPLLGGDINLYSLFVERAMSLVKPSGLVGLLTPSGIYADKTAARFFKSLSTIGRIGALFDFENRKIFFRDVHASFKFCALIFGGDERRFHRTRCAFFLHDTRAVGDPQRCFPLTPDDFSRVNPNTGTAPVFRTRRDADITRRIYERHPVLVDRSGARERRVWPVRYHTMFHMTNDSSLFRTAAELDADGYYRVAGPVEEGNEAVPAPVRGQDGTGVRPPRRQRGRQPGQPESPGPATRSHPGAAWRSRMASGSSVLGTCGFVPVGVAAGVDHRIQGDNRRYQPPYGHRFGLSEGCIRQQDTHIPADRHRYRRGDSGVQGFRATAGRQYEQLGFRLHRPPQGSRPDAESVHRRAAPRHRARRLRPGLRRHHRPQLGPRPRAPPHLRRPRHGTLRPRPRP